MSSYTRPDFRLAPQPTAESASFWTGGERDELLITKLDGATKENFVWGLRIGFITYGAQANGDAPTLHQALEHKTAGCVRGSISSAPLLSQTILLNSMENAHNPAERQEKFDILKARATRIKVILDDPRYQDAWQAYPFNSGYFMCLRLRTVNAEDLRRHLLDQYGVGLIALGRCNLRVAFSCVEADQLETLFHLYRGGRQHVGLYHQIQRGRHAAGHHGR